MINIFREPSKSCCSIPATGCFRDCFYRTNEFDHGSHTVCAIITEKFLENSKSKENDLITPKPEYQFHGLKPGKKGCLGALRWQKAFEAECAPKVELKASDKKALQHININDFILHAKK